MRAKRLPRAPGLLALALTGALPSLAGAHPMGNVSVNHYAGLEIGPGEIEIKYLLDFAELPSEIELARVDPDLDERVTPEEREAYLAAKTREVLERLRLEVNGRALPIAAARNHVAFPPGESGLSTVRVAWELHASFAADSLEGFNFLVWNDANHDDSPGWKEIRIQGEGGVRIRRSSLPDHPSSGELSTYPEEYIFAPPQHTKAWCLFGTGSFHQGTPEDASRELHPRPAQLLTSDARDHLTRFALALLVVLLGASEGLARRAGPRAEGARAALLGIPAAARRVFHVLREIRVVSLPGAILLFLAPFFPQRLDPPSTLIGPGLLTALGLSLLAYPRERDRRPPLRAAALVFLAALARPPALFGASLLLLFALTCALASRPARASVLHPGRAPSRVLRIAAGLAVFLGVVSALEILLRARG